ncbi:MAG TPA: NAD(P)-dependent oxidoreductase [Acidobacteriaceae bacterium]|nr:NAD(P)-dependent oxidoreductase [Acidobacteriaceae bacterium]
MKSIVIFGGSGFIGTHLTQTLLSFNAAEKIYLVDLQEPIDQPYAEQLQIGLRTGRVIYLRHDVREPIPCDLLPGDTSVVFNLAAVHREPGHKPQEYFETNLLGAENVCAWVATIGCRTVVFTSSISPYGPCEQEKTEASLPVPETPYGSSKLAAEKIHMMWQSGGEGRQLLVLRPGVVFGPGEGGNVTRLVRSLMKGYFVYMGNRSTIKAAGYVKELCLVTLFGLERLKETGDPSLVLNFTMDPAPTVEQMVEAIQEVTGKNRTVWNMPRSLLLGLSYTTSAAANIFGINTPINPVRVRKLFRSNNVVAEQLRNLNYRYTYSLEAAFLDWIQDCPSDFSMPPARAPIRIAPRPEAVKWDRSTMLPDVPKS